MSDKKVIFPFDFEKAVVALAYLASESDSEDERVTELTKFKAGKLLFLADKYHLVKYGRPIFGGEYRAIKHGPVPQEVLDCIQKLLAGDTNNGEGEDMSVLRSYLSVDRKFIYPRLRPCRTPDLAALSKTELDALRHVVGLHGRKSFDELRLLTHEMFAYKQVWDARGEADMVVMNYEDFFKEDADAIAGAFEEMIDDFELRNALGKV
jgi:uncharacterized phage-associated protein